MLFLVITLLTSVTCYKFPLTMTHNPSKAGVYIQINNKIKYLEISLTGDTYLYGTLNTVLLQPSISSQVKQKNTSKTIEDTDLQCPSVYCSTSQLQTIKAGQSIKTKLNITFFDDNLNIPFNMVYSGEKQQNIDGRINIFRISQALKQSNYISKKAFTLILKPPRGHVDFEKLSKIRPLLKTTFKYNTTDSLKLKGFQIGKQTLNLTQLVLTLNTDQISFPISIADQILNVLNKSSADCQWNQQKMLRCIYIPQYPQFQLMFQNNSLLLSQQSLIDRCYPSVNKKKFMCNFFISLNEGNYILGGTKFIQKFPITFDDKQVIFNIHETSEKDGGLIGLVLQSLFGWSLIQFILFLVFTGILVILKVYHLVFKCRPAKAYQKYGNLVSTSQGSIVSQNSQRDVQELDSAKQVQNI